MTVSRSRASIICFGGWGLQVMLHLWPRLRFIQDERNYLGLPLPNLDRLATFACLMPFPYLKEQDDGKRRGFCLLEPHPDNYPEPFYVERQLSREIPALSGSYTYAERTAQMLLDRALNDNYVRHLSFKGIDSLQDRFLHQEVLDIDRRVSRRLMFRLGVTSAESVAQCIVQKVVNPTRLDQVQTHDPFVQTNIYVVAPLTEPLASAMIWPILAELIADLGRRDINRVIAFFLTGSFAMDHTRAIEEASTYATLRELEIMSGLIQAPNELQPSLRELIKHKPGWERRIGQPLFDQIYLIDREKNNLSLANDAQELSVLVGNVIESFLVSNSSDYIQRYASQDHNRPYSIVGSANDYIPLREYYHAAIEEEKRRVIREAFLVDTPASSTPLIELRELRIHPNEIINNLLSHKANTILERLPLWTVFLSRLSRLPYLVYQQMMKRLGRPQPSSINHQDDTIADVRIACSYITGRSEDFGERLRRARKLWHWRSLIDERVLNLAKQLEQDIEQYSRNVWGTEYHHNRNQWWFDTSKDINSILKPYHSQTWIERYRQDKRIVPQMTVAILQRLIEMISRDTQGLNAAQNTLNKLISDIEQILQNISQHKHAQITEQRNSFENRFRLWESDYHRILSHTPHHEAIIVRIASLAMLVSFTIIGWVLFEQQTAPTVIQIIVAGVFCVTLTGLVLLLTYVPLLWRTHNIRSLRIKLAQKQLTDYFHELIQQNLQKNYQKLLNDIRILYKIVQQTKTNLTEATISINNPSFIPIPLSASTNNLRRAHAGEKIWSDVKQIVQEFGALGRIKELWSRKHSQQIANSDNPFIQRLCRALELGFNQRDLIAAIELECQRPSRSKDIIMSDLTNGRWCPFAPDSTPDRTQQNSYCSVCIEAGPGCVFSKKGINIAGVAIAVDPYDENSGSVTGGKLLAALIYELVTDTVNKLIPQQRSARERLEFFRTLLTRYNIEQIIYDQNGVTSLSSSRGFTEEFYERAKHTAYYDVCDTLHQDVREIEIVVTTDADHSVFRTEFERLGIRVLSSYDPASITIVRIVEGLKLSDLKLINRCQQDFSRLTPSDYQMIGLVEESMVSQLYIKDLSVIPYDEPAL